MSDTDDSQRPPSARAPRDWTGPSSRYRLDARRFVGPLNDPQHNDSEHDESDDLGDLVERARALVDAGYTTWIYERVRRSAPLPEAYDLRLVSQLDPGDLGDAARG